MSTNRGTQSWALLLIIISLWLGGAGLVRAASPELQRIVPAGGERGTELDVYFKGQRLKDARQVLVYEPGITVTKLVGEHTDVASAHFRIDADARIGEYHMRVVTASGISELRTFWVGRFATTQAWAGDSARKQSKTLFANLAFEHPQPLAMNTTVEGVIEDEQIHYYTVNAKKGQRLSVEVEGMRLGNAMFDPVVSILNPDQSVLANCDDTPLLKQDPYVSVIAEKDGPLIITIRDSEFGGGANASYRMHVGTFPRPAICYPLGGEANETLAVKFLGDPKGTIAQNIQLPGASPEPVGFFAKQNGEEPPSANYVRSVDFPNLMEGDADQNHDFGHATSAQIAPPFAFNGILGQAKQTDFYKFEVKQGQALDISVWGRRLGSPIDAVLVLYDAKQHYLANSDDVGGPDSELHFSPPADGEYFVTIRDYLNRGGPQYAYRMEITEPKPSVTITIPNASAILGPTQERQTIPVPRGGRYATLMRMTRNGVSGDLNLIAKSLPEGVTMTVAPYKGDIAPVLFEAKGDAPLAGKLCDFVAELVDAKAPKLEHVFGSDVVQEVALIIGAPNQTVYYRTGVHQFAVAVTQEAPFAIEVAAPAGPLVQAGQMKLKVKVNRTGDFKGAVTLHGVFDLPGISSQPIDVPAGKSEVEFPLSASEGAATGVSKICLGAVGDVKGPLWVGSNLVDLEVGKPFFRGKLQMASVEQGASTKVTCDLNQMTKFDGKAKVRLVGLPANATADECEVTAADSKVVFTVNTTGKTSVGKSTSLGVQATVSVNGQEEQQNVAQNGVLRVDPGSKMAGGEKVGQERVDAHR